MCDNSSHVCDKSSQAVRQPCASRRRFLKFATGVSFGMLGANPGRASAGPPVAIAQPQSKPARTPAEVLDLLDEGNRRFVSGKVMAPHRNLSRLKEITSRQTPMAAFLGCADSRVPIEIVFDQGFGDLFVTRVAGNVASPEIIGSLEFGTAILGAKVLYVLGHTACGAVTAAVKGQEVPGQISTLFQHLQPAVKTAKGDLNAAVRENVRFQSTLIAESSPLIADLIRKAKLKVAGGVYDIATGRVTPVEL
jgi:carbonic anhydrase